MKKEIKAQELPDPEIEDLDLEMDSIPDAQADDDDTDNDASDNEDRSPSDTDNDNESDDIEDVDMDSVPPSEEKAAGSGRQPHIQLGLHLILLAVILFIGGFSVYRLVKWNQGTKLEKIDPNEDTSEFDIETNDMIIPMDSSRLEGHEDDGVTTILCLGNNPFADDRSGDGLASLIATKTNSAVYDCSFPDSSAACRYAIYNPEYTKDHFNLYYVVESLRSGDLTAINSIAGDEPDPRYQEAVDVMKTVDMSKVDILIIMYDSTDYNNGTPSDNPDNSYDVTAFTGGLRTSLKNIQETWPHIRIFVMSPTYAQYMDEDGNLHNGTTTDLGNGTLNHYLLKEIDASMDCGVSFIDNYFGTINEDNYKEYMRDYMHVNQAGREKLADRIAAIINATTGTANATEEASSGE